MGRSSGAQAPIGIVRGDGVEDLPARAPRDTDVPLAQVVPPRITPEPRNVAADRGARILIAPLT